MPNLRNERFSHFSNPFHINTQIHRTRSYRWYKRAKRTRVWTIMLDYLEYVRLDRVLYVETTFIRFRGDPKLYMPTMCSVIRTISWSTWLERDERHRGCSRCYNEPTSTQQNHAHVNQLFSCVYERTDNQLRRAHSGSIAKRILRRHEFHGCAQDSSGFAIQLFVVRFFLISENHLKSFLNFFYFFFPFVHSIFQILAFVKKLDSFLFPFYIESVFIISVN